MLPRIPGRRLWQSPNNTTRNDDDAERERLNRSTSRLSTRSSNSLLDRFSYGASDDTDLPAVLESTSAEQDAPMQPATPRRDRGDSTTNDDQPEQDPLITLTRRLRCLFAAVTWPIVPIGTIVAIALVWLLFAAFVLDVSQSCSHPLHLFAGISLILAIYIPSHSKVRSYLFRYIRERDGNNRPLAVRRYDQVFHTTALLYVYGGITLLQSCREDLTDATTVTTETTNSCAATCPNIYQSLSVYVASLELFTLSLLLPLLLLPCLYLWFLRQAATDPEALAVLQERFREEEAFLRNGGVTTQEILEQLQDVKLVSDGSDRVLILPVGETDLSAAKDSNGVKECCICMSEFRIHPLNDVETGGDDNSTAEEPNSEEAVVRTLKCGHLFHKSCVAGWIGGRWQASESQQDDESASTPPSSHLQRRARRTTCPLCRDDMRQNV